MRSLHWRFPALLIAAVCLVSGATNLIAQDTESVAEVDLGFVVPECLGELEFPEDNLSDPRKIALGQQLYFDKRLSSDGTVACVSCHDPKHGWTDGQAVATGVGGQQGGRSAPTIINTAFNSFHFWDGRAGSLEEQCLGPIANPIEMNTPIPEAVETLNGIDGYRKQFNEIFGSDVTPENLAKAIAAYERTILSGDAPYDKFEAGDESALSESAKRGMKLFFGAANCSACHAGSNFTDNAFHNIGIGMDQPEPDLGRYAISGLGGDKGAFKTPTLREIARTAPYMHDGSLKTLREVVEHYNKGGIPNEYLDEEIFELGLTDQDITDLVAFMKEGLAGEIYPMHEAPELPE